MEKDSENRWLLDVTQNDIWISGTGYPYNLSRFLRRCVTCESTKTLIAKMNDAIPLIDAKIHVDPSDPKYMHIYQGIDTIVRRLIAKLADSNEYYKNTKLRKTGSTFSNTKVGLPHEADYMLELPDDERFKTDHRFFEEIESITTTQAGELIEGLEHWIIHGIKEHRCTGGCCLAMRYSSTVSNEVGVTVDIVPVIIVKSSKLIDLKFTGEAERYLSRNLDECIKQGDIYTRTRQRTEVDTGIIENRILKELPGDKKRPFRVVKFFLQNTIDSRHVHPYFDSVGKTRVTLYGCKPHTSSYGLRSIFLNLLIQVHGTPAELLLNDGVLGVCLLDMLTQIDEDYQRASQIGGSYPVPKHPLLEYQLIQYNMCFLDGILAQIRFILQMDNIADMVDGIKLLNYPPVMKSD